MAGVYFQRVLRVVTALVCCYVVAAAPTCLVGDFDSQVQQLLSSQLMTPAEVANLSAVFVDLQSTLQVKWPGCAVLPLGSVLTRLAMKLSDADCAVIVPHYSVYNITASRQLIHETIELLTRQPGLYYNARAKYRKKIDVLKFTYVPTQRNCDVNFIDTEALENSRLVAQYYSLDDRAFNIAAIIKFWSKLHLKFTRGELYSHMLNLLIIFYLQQENILPSYYSLQRSLDLKSSVHDFGNKDISTYQLLGGFFEYYSEFDYNEYVVSPYLGRPIPKKDFQDIDSLPEELSLYKNVTRDANRTAIELNIPMCVQDPILQSINTEIKSIDIAYFIAQMKSAARIFQLFPKDRFIREILIKDKERVTVAVTNAFDERGLQYCI